MSFRSIVVAVMLISLLHVRPRRPAEGLSRSGAPDDGCVAGSSSTRGCCGSPGPAYHLGLRITPQCVSRPPETWGPCAPRTRAASRHVGVFARASGLARDSVQPVSYTHLRAHETRHDL